MTKPTVFNVFASELALITNLDVYRFVTTTFPEHCPDYFWYIPASTRGHHHPPICRLRGGLVHHVKLAVVFADTYLDMLGIDDTDIRYSQTIAAVMLHDMLKRGATENELDTYPDHDVATRSHGRYCAEHLRKTAGYSDVTLPIIEAVRLHNGRWTADVTADELAFLKHDEVIRTTHLADYSASRALHHYLAERHVDTTMGYLKNE